MAWAAALAMAALWWWPLMTSTRAHGFGSQITWNREISRIVYAHCASCHRPEGTAFSLMTYADAQPRANEIKDAVLARRMPPWGAVKGFGHFRNDQGLMQEQIELITKWVDGGIRRGNNPRLLPSAPVFNTAQHESTAGGIRVQGAFTLSHDIVLDGLQPERVTPGHSIRITAVRPDASIEPLVWLHGYDNRYSHPFLLRRPLRLPAGSVIQGVPADAVVALIPAF
jgi:mono/diheme cytochrome c family protein